MKISFNCKRENKMCPVYKGVGNNSSFSSPMALDGVEWLAAYPNFFTPQYTHQIRGYISPRTCMDSGEETDSLVIHYIDSVTGLQKREC